MAGKVARKAKSDIRRQKKVDDKNRNRSEYAKKHPQQMVKEKKRVGPHADNHNLGGQRKTNETKGLYRGGIQEDGAHFPITKTTQKQVVADGVKERDLYRAALTPQEQLKELDRRLGEGVGAKRERARLNKQILEAETSKELATAAKELKAA